MYRLMGFRHFIAGLVLLILIVVGGYPLFGVSAKEYRPADVPMVHLQDASRYVSDPEHILSTDVVRQMDVLLASLEDSIGIQVAVVVVPAIAGGDCFDFAYRIGKDNGIGEKKRDNGLVIALSTGDRCIQFATGYGLEGILPDAICKRIQVRYMNQYFKDGKWDEGMLAGIKAVKGYLDGSMQREVEHQDNGSMDLLLFVGLPILALGILSIMARRRKQVCPNCKKHGLRLVDDRIVSRSAHRTRHQRTYSCKYCGMQTSETYTEEDDDDFRGGGFPPIIGGLGGSSFGGGRFGGSFGGGGFGGGGAGSRF